MIERDRLARAVRHGNDGVMGCSTGWASVPDTWNTSESTVEHIALPQPAVMIVLRYASSSTPPH